MPLAFSQEDFLSCSKGMVLVNLEFDTVSLGLRALHFKVEYLSSPVNLKRNS